MNIIIMLFILVCVGVGRIGEGLWTIKIKFFNILWHTEYVKRASIVFRTNYFYMIVTTTFLKVGVSTKLPPRGSQNPQRILPQKKDFETRVRKQYGNSDPHTFRYLYIKYIEKRMWIGIPIVLPHRFHKVFSLRKYVAWCWLPHRDIFVDTSNFYNLMSR